VNYITDIAPFTFYIISHRKLRVWQHIVNN